MKDKETRRIVEYFLDEFAVHTTLGFILLLVPFIALLVEYLS